MNEKQQILDELKEAVIDMDNVKVEMLCKKVIDLKMDTQDAILNGLAAGMRKVGELYENDTYSIPELLMCSETLDTGLDILKPYLFINQEKESNKSHIIIGTVEGDIHSIGKNLVKIMLEVYGFSISDLGEDVSLEKFIDKINETQGKIIALSTMMTNTLSSMKNIIDNLKHKFPEIKIMVGGASVTKSISEKLGADGFGESALEAVNIAKKFLLSEGM